MPVRVLAIVCVRNEELHIRRCLTDLIEDGVAVILIDNDSTDASAAIAREFLGRGLIGLERLPWTGSFSLSKILAAKRSIIASVDYDWVINADADEWLCSPRPGETLADAIAASDQSGFNCINFHELVFVPVGDENFETEDYTSLMTTYYFFQPSYPRLMRAWKASAGLDNFNSGGHQLEGGERRLYPTDFYLRHYIVLSENHARRKFLGRKVSADDLSRGWHGNRLTIGADSLRINWVSGLRLLPNASSKDFDLSEPFTKHFWEW